MFGKICLEVDHWFCSSKLSKIELQHQQTWDWLRCSEQSRGHVLKKFPGADHPFIQYGMKGVCAGHVRRTALVDGARIGAQNAILCLCNTTLGIHLWVHGAHNVRYKSPSGAQKSNIPYWPFIGPCPFVLFTPLPVSG